MEKTEIFVGRAPNRTINLVYNLKKYKSDYKTDLAEINTIKKKLNRTNTLHSRVTKYTFWDDCKKKLKYTRL